MALSRDEILNADDLITKEVEVPEWGGTVIVRKMSGTERDQLEASMTEEGGGGLVNFRARLVATTVVDEAGQRLFTKADVEALGKKSASALDRVAEAASELSAMSQKDIEELTENFDDDPSEDSTSA